MASVIVIPLFLLVTMALLAYGLYLAYFRLYFAKKRLEKTFILRGIHMTPREIIQKYYALENRELDDREIKYFLSHYTLDEQDQFITMYDKIRESG